MPATDYNTYAEYCNAQRIRGLQVIPERLFNLLKADEE